MTSHGSQPVTTFLDFSLLTLPKAETLNYLSHLPTPNHIHLVAASSFIELRSNAAVRDTFMSGLLVCDSKPLAKYLSFKNPEFDNFRGSDFLREFIDVTTDKRHCFIVASDLVSKQLKSYLNRLYIFVHPPLLIVAEQLSAQGDTSAWEYLIEVHNSEFIWIGLGSPKQDILADRISMRTGRVTIGIGAAIEMVVGIKTEAPIFFRNSGFEWLYRFWKEPRRLWRRYVFGNLRFLLLITQDYLMN